MEKSYKIFTSDLYVTELTTLGSVGFHPLDLVAGTPTPDQAQDDHPSAVQDHVHHSGPGVFDDALAVISEIHALPLKVTE